MCETEFPASSLALTHQGETPLSDAEIVKFLVGMQALRRERLAWALAIETLDKEAGGACITLADVVVGGYVSRTLEIAKENRDIDFSKELACLRRCWKNLTEDIGGAPRLEGSPQQ